MNSHMYAAAEAEADRQIIHLPGLQHRVTRTMYGVVTLVAWVIYAYLWLPLITLLLWVVGVRLSYIELYLQQQRLDSTVLVTLPLLLLACASLLIGWAEYNRFRFRGHERRLAQRNVRSDEVARALSAPGELCAALLDAQSAVLTMDPKGRPLTVNVGSPRGAATAPALAVSA